MYAKSRVSGSDPQTIKIFYSYSRKQDKIRDLIDQKLSEFKWDVMVEPWYDGNINPGDQWNDQINHNIDQADIILFFISNTFMQSDFIWKNEVPLALRRHAEGKARIIPIILEETDPDWKKTEIGKFQALPQNGKPLALWSDENEVSLQIIQSLVNSIVRYGISPRKQLKWKIQLEGTLKDFTPDKMDAAINFLREFTSDYALRPVDVKKGSIAILMESTSDAFIKIHTAFCNGEISQLADCKVMNIFDLYGAGITSDVATVEGNEFKPLNKQPRSDLMLLPSEQGAAAIMHTIQINDNTHGFNLGFNDTECQIAGLSVTDEKKKSLIDYFKTGLYIPNSEFWVNLTPDDNNRMLPKKLSGTAVGRLLLENDYRLKRLSASLLHPDLDSGRTYWQEVFKRVFERYGLTSIPYHSYLRVWIVPGEIFSTEFKNGLQINDLTLNTLSEREYLNLSNDQETGEYSDVTGICYDVFEERILPIIQKEINEGLPFTPLKELYSALVIAQWLKSKSDDYEWLKPSVDPDNSEKLVKEMETYCDMSIPENEEFHKKYMEIFENGIFYEVRDDYDIYSHKRITRSYFSGAIDFRNIGKQLGKSKG